MNRDTFDRKSLNVAILLSILLVVLTLLLILVTSTKSHALDETIIPVCQGNERGYLWVVGLQGDPTKVVAFISHEIHPEYEGKTIRITSNDVTCRLILKFQQVRVIGKEI